RNTGTRGRHFLPRCFYPIRLNLRHALTPFLREEFVSSDSFRVFRDTNRLNLRAPQSFDAVEIVRSAPAEPGTARQGGRGGSNDSSLCGRQCKIMGTTETSSAGAAKRVASRSAKSFAPPTRGR